MKKDGSKIKKKCFFIKYLYLVMKVCVYFDNI